METLKSFIKYPNHYAVFFYDKQMNFIGSYSISENYLYNVHVLEERKGKGHGSKMVRHATCEKRELYLDVDPENTEAKRCYERCGFVYEKKLFNYHHPCWGKGVPPATEIERYVWRSAGNL